ncbi:MAG: Hint domain-containing protein [Longimicrobiales bacterium]
MRNASRRFFIWLLGLVVACNAPLSSGPDTVLSATHLKYRLLDQYVLFYCDPDYWPVVRGDEPERALQRFPAIAADAEKFSAILEHLGLTGRTDYTAGEKLRIYREDKRLAAVMLEAAGSEYRFGLRASEEQNVFALSGDIDTFGNVTLREKTLTVGTCPICLSGETLIATAEGSERVRDLAEGSLVWSQDAAGRRTLVRTLRRAAVPIPVGHEFIRLRLADGRELLASPGHPTADGRRLLSGAAMDLPRRSK